MKKFEVTVIASRCVIVEAENKEDASQEASENCSAVGWEIDEWRVEKELTTPESIANAKRHGAVDMEDF